MARLQELGGRVVTGAPVDELPRADLVLADVAPRELARIAGRRLPERYVAALRRYRHGPGAFKLDWALSAPIPWTAAEVARAGTVHSAARSTRSRRPSGHHGRVVSPSARSSCSSQPGRFDPTRGQTAWAYCHVPNGSAEDMTERIEGQVERFAPGFRELDPRPPRARPCRPRTAQPEPRGR